MFLICNPACWISIDRVILIKMRTCIVVSKELSLLQAPAIIQNNVVVKLKKFGHKLALISYTFYLLIKKFKIPSFYILCSQIIIILAFLWTTKPNDMKYYSVLRVYDILKLNMYFPSVLYCLTTFLNKWFNYKVRLFSHIIAKNVYWLNFSVYCCNNELYILIHWRMLSELIIHCITEKKTLQ